MAYLLPWLNGGCPWTMEYLNAVNQSIQLFCLWVIDHPPVQLAVGAAERNQSRGVLTGAPAEQRSSRCHAQRLNAHALLGAQRAEVGSIRATWVMQNKLAVDGRPGGESWRGSRPT
jgi:hypothetical protein